MGSRVAALISSLALCTATCLGACSPTTGVQTPIASPPPATSVPSGAAQVSVTEADGGRVVDLTMGDVVVVTLHNTYWRFTPAGPGLSQVGDAVVSPAPRGTCLPGIGCGMVVARYRATARGEAVVRARRTTCGEALPCPRGQGVWTLRVRIG
ncbi:MAG: hypothetical protein JWP82_352 [Humibacillus sp.]|nr:hypothetical protein [Humibacillus sp.]